MKTTMRTDILRAILNFFAEHGCAPTEREIAELVKISKTTVHYHIGKLREAGELRKIDAGGRSLAIPAQTDVQQPALLVIPAQPQQQWRDPEQGK